MRVAILLATLAITGVAQAQSGAIPGGWTIHERIGPSSVVDLGCAREVAYARDWSGAVARWDGTTWAMLPRRSESMYGRTLGVTPDGQLFLESGGGIAQWDGAQWIDHRLDRWESEGGGAFAAISPTEVYYVGRGRIARFDGRTWTTHDGGTWRQLTSIALAGDDLLIGGEGGTILRFRGGVLTREPTGIDTTVDELVAFAPDDVWARAGSTLLHFDGRAWARGDTDVIGPLTAIGGAAHRLYAVGALGVSRWSGTSWTPELTASDLGERSRALVDVCATDHHVIVVDGGGRALVRSR